MKERHTPHGAPGRVQTREGARSSTPGAEPNGSHEVERSIRESIDSAISELDALEMPHRPSVPVVAAAAQQMPRGMPLLPFKAPHPSNMPPLPPPSAGVAPAPLESSGVVEPPPPTPAVAPRRSPLVVAAALVGLVCAALALWLWRR
jgi:hypothetical protein